MLAFVLFSFSACTCPPLPGNMTTAGSKEEKDIFRAQCFRQVPTGFNALLSQAPTPAKSRGNTQTGGEPKRRRKAGRVQGQTRQPDADMEEEPSMNSLLLTMGRLCLRQEDELAAVRADKGSCLFMDIQRHPVPDFPSLAGEDGCGGHQPHPTTQDHPPAVSSIRAGSTSPGPAIEGRSPCSGKAEPAAPRRGDAGSVELSGLGPHHQHGSSEPDPRSSAAGCNPGDPSHLGPAHGARERPTQVPFDTPIGCIHAGKPGGLSPTSRPEGDGGSRSPQFAEAALRPSGPTHGQLPLAARASDTDAASQRGGALAAARVRNLVLSNPHHLLYELLDVFLAVAPALGPTT